MTGFFHSNQSEAGNSGETAIPDRRGRGKLGPTSPERSRSRTSVGTDIVAIDTDEQALNAPRSAQALLGSSVHYTLAPAANPRPTPPRRGDR
jgi:hypothetical protein